MISSRNASYHQQVLFTQLVEKLLKHEFIEKGTTNEVNCEKICVNNMVR